MVGVLTVLIKTLYLTFQTLLVVKKFLKLTITTTPSVKSMAPYLMNHHHRLWIHSIAPLILHSIPLHFLVRTSILGDTIDYMKELLEKINNLRQEVEVDSNMAGIFKDVKPNEILVRNSPKFEVERSVDTRVEICCVGKPGLILSTVNTLKALGLEIQQCVISCFNDFTMQASCSEESEQRTMLSFEDIKQALFRSAGYGGRCL
ncbi:hypothetical protein JHK82_050541 [Glycine max]|uniref:Transcription factor bHLH93 n=1 Tax=Glycine soja TaxID=3848 RepID=A0A445FTH8_GLYSO|nr:hypothetical protein JHK86_050391 [Glycine max]KAG4936334.1 hypothetical protein JHK85_051253 [Glycine max]KAG5091763.1 hypothetical protein JHK82_050541 [Glycine max]KAG5094862.1 hypothetical protein JHK84_050450 [Glycine max]RZB52220.1 Transcription factor bHLH93 [Glycine soja]